ncbi:NnrU family protein [Thalassospiraceae bacterium LMO-JJ14]|nr:NnrU family protein [Thalassospiraceae bacterium LMO-JJ14]
MIYLITGLATFFVVHAFPWFPAWRSAAREKLGVSVYITIFVLFSLGSLALIVLGYATTERAHLWAAPAWGRTLAYIAVPLAVTLVISAYGGTNIQRLTAHPLSWGIGLWAAVHLLNNGDLPSLLMFGVFLIYAAVAGVAEGRKGVQKVTMRAPLWRDALALVIGGAVAAAIAHLHENLFGVSVL